jgi:hypothetical protein
MPKRAACGRARSLALAMGIASLWATLDPPVRAQDAADSPCAAPASPTAAEGDVRRRPGATPPEAAQAAPCDPTRMPPPGDAPLPVPAAATDRWRLTEQLGRPVNFVNPYESGNPLKGDRPTFGQDVFLNLSATSNTLLEPRLIPTVDGETTPAGERTITRNQQFLSQTLAFDAVLYEGDTVFRPPDWQVRFSPAVNFSDTLSKTGDTGGGVFAVQGLSFEKHLRDVSPRYDFDSVRLGIQPIVSDFRGFLLSDQPIAARLFGTRDNNIFQYNIALLTRIPKDRVRLNDLSQKIPNNQVLLANLYWQDLFVFGVTSEFIFAYNRNRGTDAQDLLSSDPATAPVPGTGPHDYSVTYLGYSLDGHIGRLDSTGAVYGLFGHEREGTFTSESTTVRAAFVAEELSMDFDWRRVRFSALHSSGDGNPYDRRAEGFDTLTSGAIFAGSDSSFFFHQRLALAGGLFDLKSRDGLLPSLRAANNSVESDFSNPGLDLLGLGLDLSLTPALTLSVDANQLWFDKTESLQALLDRPTIARRLGAEMIVDAIWRPFTNQNFILRLSAAQMLSGPGYRAIYAGSNPYSLFALLAITY